VEIKEFTPNDEDNAFAATLEKEGKASVDNRSIGRRVRKAIIDSAPQLRRYQDTPLPEILLLYDNLASDSYGGIIDYLDPMNVGAGMFGEPSFDFGVICHSNQQKRQMLPMEGDVSSPRQLAYT